MKAGATFLKVEASTNLKGDGGGGTVSIGPAEIGLYGGEEQSLITGEIKDISVIGYDRASMSEIEVNGGVLLNIGAKLNLEKAANSLANLSVAAVKWTAARAIDFKLAINRVTP